MSRIARDNARWVQEAMYTTARRNAVFLFVSAAWVTGASLTAVNAAPVQAVSPAPADVVISATAAAPTATPTATPSAAGAAVATGSPTPSLLKKVGVKIQFLPPPMQGLISLGIYDSTGKLVRVLHREATQDEFVAALDGFITNWDGLGDDGQPLPPGRYDARGYMVGAVTVRALPMTPPAASGSSAVVTGSSAASPSPAPAAPDTLAAALPALKFPNGEPFTPLSKVRASLVPNPLERDRAGSAELSVGFDSKGSWLQTRDGLPLKQISAMPNLKWAALGRSAPGEPLVIFQSDGATLQEWVITKVASMMAFDCGGFDLTTAGN